MDAVPTEFKGIVDAFPALLDAAAAAAAPAPLRIWIDSLDQVRGQQTLESLGRVNRSSIELTEPRLI